MIDVLSGFGVQMILDVDLAVDSNGEFSWVYSVEARGRVSNLEVGFLDFGATYGHESNIKSDNKDTRKLNMQLFWALRMIIENVTSFGPLTRRSGMEVFLWLKLVLEHHNGIARHNNDIGD